MRGKFRGRVLPLAQHLFTLALHSLKMMHQFRFIYHTFRVAYQQMGPLWGSLHNGKSIFDFDQAGDFLHNRLEGIGHIQVAAGGTGEVVEGQELILCLDEFARHQFQVGFERGRVP